MCVFQAVDKSFFFAGCFLVSIRKRKQEYKYKKYDIDKLKETLAQEFSGETGTFYFVINVDKKMN